MSIALVEAFSGASGNMLLGALFDAGLDIKEWRAKLSVLDLGPVRFHLEKVTRHGLAGTQFDVILPETAGHDQENLHAHGDTEPHSHTSSAPHSHDDEGGHSHGHSHAEPHEHSHSTAGDAPREHHHRGLAEIEGLIRSSGLSQRVVEQSTAVFRRLARAEAHVHGTTVEKVHFHEVGAVDSITDIVGFCLGLEMLGIESLHSVPLTVGGGHVWTQHGLLPAPAPATQEILREAQVPVRRHPKAETEILTPTGAALLAELARFSTPMMVMDRVGYGFGTREFPWANALRISVGHEDDSEADAVWLLACNLDNTTGETLGFALERGLEAGALDVWFTPIQMKKNRPAVELSMLVRPEDVERLSGLMLRETGTLGVRRSVWQRSKASRETVRVETQWGAVRVKEKRLHGVVVSAAAEYEDCAALARLANVPIDAVREAALSAWRGGVGSRRDASTTGPTNVGSTGEL
jgi:pyridinium-3,5-bisthiocarboxylic acid mononucleotide nickel chelatase